MRVNKTVKNLQEVWTQLDNASGALYNVLHDLALMTDLPEDVKRSIELIDVSIIDTVKNEVEELIQEKARKREELS